MTLKVMYIYKHFNIHFNTRMMSQLAEVTIIHQQPSMWFTKL